MRWMAILAFAVASPAVADEFCHDLWLARNAIMDRAGYCFGSVLGQAVFDNADCVGKSVSLTPDAQATVARIQERESENACRVNTKQTTLDVKALELRLDLVHQPVRDLYESACLGWLGPVTPLRAGHDGGAAVVGEVHRGDFVLYSHEPVGDWAYVTVSDSDWLVITAGWMDFSSVDETCTDYAG